MCVGWKTHMNKEKKIGKWKTRQGQVLVVLDLLIFTERNRRPGKWSVTIGS